LRSTRQFSSPKHQLFGLVSKFILRLKLGETAASAICVRPLGFLVSRFTLFVSKDKSEDNFSHRPAVIEIPGKSIWLHKRKRRLRPERSPIGSSHGYGELGKPYTRWSKTEYAPEALDQNKGCH
jgi:hypothetical protein